MKRLSFIALILGIAALLCACAVSVPVSLHYPDMMKYTAGSCELTDNVSEIEVEWVSGSVTVASYDGEKLVVKEDASEELVEDSSLHYLLDEGKLSVKYSKSGAFVSSALSKDITILVPETYELGLVYINVISADISLADLYAKELRVVAISADTSLSRVSIGEKLDISTVSGTVTSCSASSLAGAEVSINTVSGDVKLDTRLGLPESVFVDSTSANISLTLPELSGFELKFTTLSGELIGLPRGTEHADSDENDGSYTYRDREISLNINSVSGNMIFESTAPAEAAESGEGTDDAEGTEG